MRQRNRVSPAAALPARLSRAATPSLRPCGGLPPAGLSGSVGTFLFGRWGAVA